MINKYTALAQGEKKNHEQRPLKEQISEANPQKQRAKRPTLLGNMPPKKQKLIKAKKAKTTSSCQKSISPKKSEN